MRKILSLVLLCLALCGCAVVPRQKAMAALSGQARSKCLAKPETCAALADCQHQAQLAVIAWTGYSRTVAAGADETDALSEALIQEAAARTICAVAGVK